MYDSANRLTETHYPDGTSTKTGYDAEGNRITSTDQLGHVTTNTYNANKQLIKTSLACVPATATNGSSSAEGSGAQ